jgi:hypothetical protein
MKITKISLQNFRAFDEPFELDLDGGKNLLLHGENGSGKSSIYFALKRFFEERGDNIANHLNHFAPKTRAQFVRIHITGDDTTGKHYDEDVEWDAAAGHPLPVPVSSGGSQLTSGMRSLLTEGAHRAGFLDYRAMLRTSHLSGPLSRSNRGPKIHDAIYGNESGGLYAQLFDLVSLVVLAGVPVATTGGGQSTIGSLMRKVWENRPQNRWRNVVARANAHTNAFNAAFNAKLSELEKQFPKFLDQFHNHQLTVKFTPVALSWDKDKLQLKGAELVPDITFRGEPITDHQQFLNEARLSALATCLFLAGTILADNDYTNPNHPRFLVLDDALIGLELQNRLPILNILTSDAFKNYQIFLLTYDRVWFELACGHLKREAGWVHHELLADEDTGRLVPRHKSAKTDVETADAHLKNHDVRAAAVYARAAFEWKLRNVCEKNGIKIPFKPDADKVTVNFLWDGILQRQRDREAEKAKGSKAPDFVPKTLETAVETMRSTVLNKLSHTGSSSLVESEVATAIATVRLVHTHTFPSPKDKASP